MRALTQLALAHPHVHLRVTNNVRAVLTAPAASDLRQRVGALWGHEIAVRLLAVDRAEHGVGVRGLASPPDLTRGNREEIVLIVNGRPVRDPALLQATLDACRPLLPRDRFPIVLLAITVSESDVDVNVHPTKAWVVPPSTADLRDGRRRDPGGAPPSRGDSRRRRAPGRPASARRTRVGVSPSKRRSSAHRSRSTREPSSAGCSVRYRTRSSSRPSGRRCFPRSARGPRTGTLRAPPARAPGRCARPGAALPRAARAAPAACALLERWREPLERLGFAFEGFGGAAIVVRAVPALLKGSEPRRLIEAAVDELAGAGALAPTLDRALAFVACRAAVKANTPLAREEMERLVVELSSTETPLLSSRAADREPRLAS